MADLAVEPTSVEGPERTTMARILRAPFGDGYSQRAGDGINVLVDQYSVEWEHLDTDEEASLVAQLEGAYGVTCIDWTPPDQSVSRKFTIAEWSKTIISGNVGRAYKLRASLVREFDL